MEIIAYKILASSALKEVHPDLKWGERFWFEDSFAIYKGNTSVNCNKNNRDFWDDPISAIKDLQRQRLWERPWQLWKFYNFSSCKDPELIEEFTEEMARKYWHEKHNK